MYQFQARGKINKLCCFSLLLYMSHIAPSPLLSKFLFYKNSSSRFTMKNFTDTKHKINGKWCIVCFPLYQRDEAILKRSFNNNFLYPIHSSCALILMSYALECLFNTPAAISWFRTHPSNVTVRREGANENFINEDCNTQY